MNWNKELIQADGELYYKTETGLEKASLTDIVKNYRTMQYNLHFCIGLWATDRPDLIEDPKNILYEIKYMDIPENTERVK